MSPIVRIVRPVAIIVRLVVPPLILIVGLWAGWQLFRSTACSGVICFGYETTLVHLACP